MGTSLLNLLPKHVAVNVITREKLLKEGAVSVLLERHLREYRVVVPYRNPGYPLRNSN